MKTRALGNLFELAEHRLQHEVKNCLRRSYTALDVIDYAIVIRKQLDKYGKSGRITKVKNVHTGKVMELASPYSLRHLKYVETGK